MNDAASFPWPVFIILGGLVITLVARMLRFGGFAGALFGARIVETPGEIQVQGTWLLSGKLKVHRLDGAKDRDVGIELVVGGPLKRNTLALPLSISEARQLLGLLQSALGRHAGTRGDVRSALPVDPIRRS